MTQQERRDYWQQHLTKWQASGLSGMAFCQQQALAYHKFSYWRQKLVSEASAESHSPAGFATVISTKAVGPESHEKPGLTVSLPGGITITGVNAHNVALLGDVLRQL
ncbi:IS66 family insertion sequence element accessory protein TnpA [Vreelandella titanicae]|uniref:IS66 family insertion sequence element accessory protein TnpB n=1 Tax=Vreelandella titanicae TaxID=664683 RepID=A0AAP9NLQ6_9GAMM|nr:IS66 family insertion sequence element accessory protein TnpB [Halomonas titanicae]QKS24046.1 hypothetical protein FX987_01813 [Halomonas titanicae]QKS26725.1 hypothetical protein FX987_04541 [Halomonas titanicae]QKS26743.1 hypothetical protein FX987_04559 [Halomonas titanicae]